MSHCVTAKRAHTRSWRFRRRLDTTAAVPALTYLKVLASAPRLADNLHRELHKHSNREPDDENS